MYPRLLRLNAELLSPILYKQLGLRGGKIRNWDVFETISAGQVEYVRETVAEDTGYVVEIRQEKTRTHIPYLHYDLKEGLSIVYDR